MNERNRDRTTRKIVLLNEKQIKPFQAICRNVTNELGSQQAAAKALGVSIFTFRSLLIENHLTDKMARVILARRKAMKSNDSTA